MFIPQIYHNSWDIIQHKKYYLKSTKLAQFNTACYWNVVKMTIFTKPFRDSWQLLPEIEAECYDSASDLGEQSTTHPNVNIGTTIKQTFDHGFMTSITCPVK